VGRNALNPSRTTVWSSASRIVRDFIGLEPRLLRRSDRYQAEDYSRWRLTQSRIFCQRPGGHNISILWAYSPLVNPKLPYSRFIAAKVYSTWAFDL
jgi:hypothetical protein